MATVINNPGTTDSGNNSGLIIGIVLLLLVVVGLVLFGVPYFRGGRVGSNSGSGTTPTTIENNVQGGTPQGGNTPQINVPDKVDVNINKGQ